MKSILLCLLTTLCLVADEPAGIRFANEEVLVEALKNSEFRKTLQNALEKRKEADEIEIESIQELGGPPNKGYFYIKSGATSGVLYTEASPLIGLGYRSKLQNTKDSNSIERAFRRIFSKYSFDCNVQASTKVYKDFAALELYLPKFSTLYYFTPEQPQSFFWGYGASFAIMTPMVYKYENPDTNEVEITYGENTFVGFGTSVVAGYTPTLHEKYLNSVQLELNLPVQSMFENDFKFYGNNWTLNLTYCIGY